VVIAAIVVIVVLVTRTVTAHTSSIP